MNRIAKYKKMKNSNEKKKYSEIIYKEKSC